MSNSLGSGVPPVTWTHYQHVMQTYGKRDLFFLAGLVKRANPVVSSMINVFAIRSEGGEHAVYAVGSLAYLIIKEAMPDLPQVSLETKHGFLGSIQGRKKMHDYHELITSLPGDDCFFHLMMKLACHFFPEEDHNYACAYLAGVSVYHLIAAQAASKNLERIINIA